MFVRMFFGFQIYISPLSKKLFEDPSNFKQIEVFLEHRERWKSFTHNSLSLQNVFKLK